MLVINSNGSKWAGESPDPLEAFEERLGKHTLCPQRLSISPARSWKDNSPIHPDSPDCVRFSGNFHDLSAVFSIDTDEPAIIARLTALINANMATPEFKAAQEDELKRLAYWEERDREKEVARKAARQRQYEKLQAEFSVSQAKA